MAFGHPKNKLNQAIKPMVLIKTKTNLSLTKYFKVHIGYHYGFNCFNR